MKLRTLIICLAPFSLSGCAEHFLENAESGRALNSISSSELHDDVITLSQASQKAKMLAISYVRAARKVGNVQDITAATVIVSAGSAAYGAVTGASNQAIANRAVPGVVAGLSGRRYGGRLTISAIYSGAQRLNCISSKAGIAAQIGDVSRLGFEGAALVATRSAILDAQIMTRADVARENAEFISIFSEFRDGMNVVATKADKSNEKDTAVLNDYITELLSCLESEDPSKAARLRQVSGEVNGNTDIPDSSGMFEG